jgi:hypothetical protein
MDTTKKREKEPFQEGQKIIIIPLLPIIIYNYIVFYGIIVIPFFNTI